MAPDCPPRIVNDARRNTTGIIHPITVRVFTFHSPRKVRHLSHSQISHIRKSFRTDVIELEIPPPISSRWWCADSRQFPSLRPLIAHVITLINLTNQIILRRKRSNCTNYPPPAGKDASPWRISPLCRRKDVFAVFLPQSARARPPEHQSLSYSIILGGEELITAGDSFLISVICSSLTPRLSDVSL